MQRGDARRIEIEIRRLHRGVLQCKDANLGIDLRAQQIFEQSFLNRILRDARTGHKDQRTIGMLPPEGLDLAKPTLKVVPWKAVPAGTILHLEDQPSVAGPIQKEERRHCGDNGDSKTQAHQRNRPDKVLRRQSLLLRTKSKDRPRSRQSSHAASRGASSAGCCCKRWASSTSSRCSAEVIRPGASKSASPL